MFDPKLYTQDALVPMVVEQTSRGERSYDIFSRLLNDRESTVKQGLFLPKKVPLTSDGFQTRMVLF